MKEHPIDCQCGNHEAHYVALESYKVPSGAVKEAIASCRLDGDTMSCERCPLGKDYKKQLIEEIAHFLHGEISKEKLAGNLRMNFYELDELLRGFQFKGKEC